MDLFDKQILAMLSDGKPKVLAQLLDEADFSRNTVKLHLKRLLSQALVEKEKMPSNGKGFGVTLEQNGRIRPYVTSVLESILNNKVKPRLSQRIL